MSEKLKGLAIICFILMFVIWQIREPVISNASQNNLKKDRATSSFAVIINTFKRPKRLRNSVRYYAESCGKAYGVNQVFVVWSEIGVEPPHESEILTPDEALNEKQKQNRATFKILKMKQDSLNNRFLPIEQLKSDTIFMVDDDIEVKCPSLFFGFEASLANPDVIVGYYARTFDENSDNTFKYRKWPTSFFRDEFRFILPTKGSFLHKRYLDLYTSPEHPQEIKEMVEKGRNCEDIAMAFLVSNYTKNVLHTDQEPVYIQGSLIDKGTMSGISTTGGHFHKRDKCLTDINNLYKKRNWDPALKKLKLSKHIWGRNNFWWQTRPSSIFEWI